MRMHFLSAARLRSTRAVSRNARELDARVAHRAVHFSHERSDDRVARRRGQEGHVHSHGQVEASLLRARRQDTGVLPRRDVHGQEPQAEARWPRHVHLQLQGGADGALAVSHQHAREREHEARAQVGALGHEQGGDGGVGRRAVTRRPPEHVPARRRGSGRQAPRARPRPRLPGPRWPSSLRPRPRRSIQPTHAPSTTDGAVWATRRQRRARAHGAPGARVAARARWPGKAHRPQAPPVGQAPGGRREDPTRAGNRRREAGRRAALERRGARRPDDQPTTADQPRVGHDARAPAVEEHQRGLLDVGAVGADELALLLRHRRGALQRVVAAPGQHRRRLGHAQQAEARGARAALRAAADRPKRARAAPPRDDAVGLQEVVVAAPLPLRGDAVVAAKVAWPRAVVARGLCVFFGRRWP